MYAILYLLEINKHSCLMTCHAYMLTGVGLDLMPLLGWVSIHDTHHHMGFLRKNFVVVIFGVWIFGLLHRWYNTLETDGTRRCKWQYKVIPTNTFVPTDS